MQKTFSLPAKVPRLNSLTRQQIQLLENLMPKKKKRSDTWQLVLAILVGIATLIREVVDLLKTLK
jgi:hypothetical protein